jgi:hypothetical protein
MALAASRFSIPDLVESSHPARPMTLTVRISTAIELRRACQGAFDGYHPAG